MIICFTHPWPLPRGEGKGDQGTGNREPASEKAGIARRLAINYSLFTINCLVGDAIAGGAGAGLFLQKFDDFAGDIDAS